MAKLTYVPSSWPLSIYIAVIVLVPRFCARDPIDLGGAGERAKEAAGIEDGAGLYARGAGMCILLIIVGCC